MPDGKLYLYGSFDDGKHIYWRSRYHVGSTPDMEHWTIHDCSLTAAGSHGHGSGFSEISGN